MISIITPAYNGKRFIELCINNVIEQNCPSVEHIIVDGGSTDGTVEIIKKYADTYKHIRWISEKDKGQSDGMNKGVAMAQGEVLGFLNIDDYYEPGVLNRVEELFKTLPEPSLLVGNCNVRSNEGDIKWVNKPKHLKITHLLLGDESICPFPVNPSAYFYHRSLHQVIGVYDSEEHFTMDLDFLLKAIKVATVKYVDETWGNFRYIEGTKTFEDMKKGKGILRYQEFLIKHRKKLPLSQRLEMVFLYVGYKNRQRTTNCINKVMNIFRMKA